MPASRTSRGRSSAQLTTINLMRRARAELFEYLEVFYNAQRRHSALEHLSPRAFEQQQAHAVAGNLTGASPLVPQAVDPARRSE